MGAGEEGLLVRFGWLGPRGAWTDLWTGPQVDRGQRAVWPECTVGDASKGSVSQIPTSYEELRESSPAEGPWPDGLGVPALMKLIFR